MFCLTNCAYRCMDKIPKLCYSRISSGEGNFSNWSVLRELEEDHGKGKGRVKSYTHSSRQGIRNYVTRAPNMLELFYLTSNMSSEKVSYSVYVST